jgi:hypothetical protein
VQLQYSVLESLLQQQTAYSFNVFRDIINTEAPVLDVNTSGNWNGYPARRALRIKNISYDNGSFLDELLDSLQLTHTILPDLLPLLNLTDYKSSLMRLLGILVDSGLVKPKEYEQYFSKFLIEAKQELKKQSIAEKKKAIEKAEDNKDTKKPSHFIVMMR